MYKWATALRQIRKHTQNFCIRNQHDTFPLETKAFDYITPMQVSFLRKECLEVGTFLSAGNDVIFPVKYSLSMDICYFLPEVHTPFKTIKNPSSINERQPVCLRVLIIWHQYIHHCGPVSCCFFPSSHVSMADGQNCFYDIPLRSGLTSLPNLIFQQPWPIAMLMSRILSWPLYLTHSSLSANLPAVSSTWNTFYPT